MIRRALAAAFLAAAACAPEAAPPALPAPAPPASPPVASIVPTAAPEPPASSAAPAEPPPEPPAEVTPPPGWPADVPPLRGATVDSRLATPRVTRVWIEREDRDVPTVLRAWIDAVKRRGGRVVAEHEDSASFAAADGKRSYVTMRDASSGVLALFGRARRPPARLASPCVPIPTPRWEIVENATGVTSEGEPFNGSVFWKMTTDYTIDADGDGELDAMVPEKPDAGACPSEVSNVLYIMRGGCGHAVGVVGPGFPDEAVHDSEPEASGFRRLTVVASTVHLGQRALPESVERRTVFSFVSGAYRKQSETTRKGTCHHCGVRHCTVRP